MLRALWLHLAYASLSVCILVPLILLARRLLRGRVDPRVLYGTWLLVALRLVVPLRLEARLATQWLPMAAAPEVPTGLVEAAAPQTMAAQDAALLPGTGAPLYVIALLLWAIGMVAVAGYSVLRNLRFSVAIRGAVPMGDAVLQPYRGFCLRRGVKLPRVAVTAAVASPCLYGALRPRVLLPGGEMDEVVLRYALLHEACHAKAQDTRWALLRTVLCCVFWFHPLVWAAAKVSRVDAEHACDAQVIRSIRREERFDYARALVGVATGSRGMQPALVAGIPFADERLSGRVKQIVEGKMNIKKTGGAVLLCVLALVMMASFVTAETDSRPKGRVPEETEMAVYKGANEFELLPLPAGEVEVQGLANDEVHIIADGDIKARVPLSAIELEAGIYNGTTALVNNPNPSDRLNLREMPRTSSTSIGSYYNGQEVEVLEYGMVWCHVRINGKEGYMMTQFLAFGDEVKEKVAQDQAVALSTFDPVAYQKAQAQRIAQLLAQSDGE